MSSRNREFDIIVWGASGFTGRLVAEYIFQKYNSEDLKWGIAGRDKTKLSSVRDTYLSKNIPILIGDSFDERSLNKITSRTKVICSTVGPYSKYNFSRVIFESIIYVSITFLLEPYSPPLEKISSNVLMFSL